MKITLIESLWFSHLENCLICRKAIQGRFAGKTPREMLCRSCHIGRPLYEGFIEETDNQGESLKEKE